jgi:hypothetical protein
VLHDFGMRQLNMGQLAEINKKITKGDAFGVWAHLEALGTVVPQLGEWYMNDDGEQLQETVKLIGCALINTLKTLKDKGMLNPESPVKNLALAVGWLLEIDNVNPGDSEEDWTHAAILMVKKSGLTFEGRGAEMETTIKKYEEDLDEDDEDIEPSKFDWKKDFANFKSRYSVGTKLGGTHYVLTKGKKGKGGGTGRGAHRMWVTVGPGEDPDDFW